MTPRTAIGLAFLALAACSPKTDEASTATPTAPVGAVLDTSPDIAAADLAARTKELADDKFEGRGPGTVAGEASAQWIADEMKRIGLAPGNGDSYFQTVEMVAQTVIPEKSSLSISTPDKTFDYKLGPDAVFITKRQDKDQVSFSDSDLIFVGYGVVAPEADWNDYAGVDVHGKTVVMFVNDPGFITHDDSLFNGKAMTYYGRWTYKFEEAARQGAEAVLLIHETAPAAYGWNVVESSWTGEQADLVRADAGASRALLEGWVTLDHAKELFDAAGLDIDQMRAAANKRGFKAVPMTGLKASATITQTVEKRDSRNVIGVLEGSSHPDEYMLYMAHWDHLGVDPSAPEGADRFYNGAVDNATGVSMMLDIAEKFASGPPPARSVVFLAVTLEESGLLGSAYYGENPIIPLNKTVAGVNMDAVMPIGPTRDMVVVGYGASQLEDMLKDILATDNRVVVPDPQPEAGSFYRSDHISLAKHGVPMLYADGGVDMIDGGTAHGEELSDAYRDHDYHSVSDNFHDDWDFSGSAQDATALYEVGRRIADSDLWPEWYEGNEFRGIREASLNEQ
ncbi:MAG: M28 family metallopeptidase [Hyphomonadaceae bacterium]